MNLKKWAALALTTVVAAACLSGCGNSVSTKVETVNKSDHPVALTLDANMTALHMTTIVPKISGKLVSAPLTKGQEVKAGETVVQIDTSPYQASVSQAEAELVAASSAATTYRTVTVPAAGGDGGGDNGGQRAQLNAYYKDGYFSRAEFNQLMSKNAPAAQTQTVQVPQTAPVDHEKIAAAAGRTICQRNAQQWDYLFSD